MRAIVAWLGALGAVGAPQGEAAAGEAFPIPLTRSTFPLFVTADGLALVEFRSGGAPDGDFAQAAWLLRDVIPLGTVDVLREPQLAITHNATDTPSVRLFRRGVGTPLGGGLSGKSGVRVGGSVEELVAYCLDEFDRLITEDAAEPPARIRAAGAHHAWTHADADAEPPGERGGEASSTAEAPRRLHSVSELAQLRHVEDVLVLGLFLSDADPPDADAPADAARAATDAAAGRAAYAAAARALADEHLLLHASDEWLVGRLLGAHGAECAHPDAGPDADAVQSARLPCVLMLRAGEPPLRFGARLGARRLDAEAPAEAATGTEAGAESVTDGADALIDWVRTHGHAPLVQLTHHTLRRRLLDHDVPSLVLLLPASAATPRADTTRRDRLVLDAEQQADADAAPASALLGAFRRLSAEFADDLYFYYAISAPEMAPLASALSLELNAEVPSLAIFDPAVHRRYVYPHDLPLHVGGDADGAMERAMASVRHFIETFLDGVLVPTRRAQPLPLPTHPRTGNSSACEGVVHVGAGALEAHLDAPSRDVVIGFHAPW